MVISNESVCPCRRLWGVSCSIKLLYRPSYRMKCQDMECLVLGLEDFQFTRNTRFLAGCTGLTDNKQRGKYIIFLPQASSGDRKIDRKCLSVPSGNEVFSQHHFSCLQLMRNWITKSQPTTFTKRGLVLQARGLGGMKSDSV